MCTFLQNEKLLNPNQSSFCPSDSYITQILSITHEIFWSFDATLPLEVRLVLSDTSKTFDKIWHDSLLYKLNSLENSSKCIN